MEIARTRCVDAGLARAWRCCSSPWRVARRTRRGRRSKTASRGAAGVGTRGRGFAGRRAPALPGAENARQARLLHREAGRQADPHRARQRPELARPRQVEQARQPQRDRGRPGPAGDSAGSRPAAAATRPVASTRVETRPLERPAAPVASAPVTAPRSRRRRPRVSRPLAQHRLPSASQRRRRRLRRRCAKATRTSTGCGRPAAP